MRIWSHLLNKYLIENGLGTGRFPRIAGNAGNHGNDGTFYESHKIPNQI